MLFELPILYTFQGNVTFQMEETLHDGPVGEQEVLCTERNSFILQGLGLSGKCAGSHGYHLY
jgi:hypothetical protein